VEFVLAAGDLMFTGLNNKPVVEPGEFTVWVGPNSSHGLLQGAFSLVDKV